MEQDRAIILLNMGGANNLDEVELFLRNMFSDSHILPMNPLFRKFIGNMIVKKRLEEAKENYRLIGGKSPLNEISLSLAKKIKAITNTPTYLIMRYVPPFAKDILNSLKAKGVKELILFPMYPHYSTTTTLSSIKDIEDNLRAINYHPRVKVIKDYYDDYSYLNIQASLIEEASKDIDIKGYSLILSAHSLPLSIIKRGDPYQNQIEANASALKTLLKCKGIEFKEIKLAYQSKVGKSAWLEPNLADILRKPKNLRVLIFPLSFTIDNSETIFELDIEHRDIANKIGYKDYRVAKCPNDRDEFAKFIGKKIEKLI